MSGSQEAFFKIKNDKEIKNDLDISVELANYFHNHVDLTMEKKHVKVSKRPRRKKLMF